MRLGASDPEFGVSPWFLGEILQGNMAERDLKGDGREKGKGAAAESLLLTGEGDVWGISTPHPVRRTKD